MVIHEDKCMRQMTKFIKDTKTTISIARTLKYIIRCVINETEPFQRHFSASSSTLDIKLYQAWQDQKSIRWTQVFKRRISTKWIEAQNIYYASNPDTKDDTKYSASIWASRIIKNLIEVALDLWVTRRKKLHGERPEIKIKI